MDAIALLTEDHKKVRKLLKELDGTSEGASRKRAELIETIAHELKVHTEIEQDIFYPAFRKACGDAEGDKIYFDSLEEHKAMGDVLIPDAQHADPASAEFAGKAQALKDAVDNHADEEEKVMFHEAKKAMSKDELNRLGEQLESRKKDLMRQFRSAA